MLDRTRRLALHRRIRLLSRQLEEQNALLSRRAIEVESLTRELNGFFYSVSHDLRSPLRTIQGFGEALADSRDCLDEEGQNYLARVLEATTRMDDLFNDLHSLAQVSRGDLRRETVNLSEIAESIVAALRERDPRRNVKLTVEPGLIVEGDSALLRIALEHILRNAWKFTRPHLSANITVGREHGERQTFYVRDDGVGFDPKYATRLFSPFQRLHGETEFEGNGIGLSIVQRIILRHAGTVRAIAKTEEGATVFFELK